MGAKEQQPVLHSIAINLAAGRGVESLPFDQIEAGNRRHLGVLLKRPTLGGRCSNRVLSIGLSPAQPGLSQVAVRQALLPSDPLYRQRDGVFHQLICMSSSKYKIKIRTQVCWVPKTAKKVFNSTLPVWYLCLGKGRAAGLPRQCNEMDGTEPNT